MARKYSLVFVSLIVILMLYSTGLSPAMQVMGAKPTPSPTPEQVTFDAGQVTHTLSYTQDTSVLKDRVIAAAQKSIEVFQPLWDAANNTVAFKLQITLTSKASKDLGGAYAISKGVCPISLWDDGQKLETGDVVETTLAHEIAHCYQEQYIKGQNTPAPIPGTDWLIEGSADWLATLVYPDAAAGYWNTTFVQDYQAHKSVYSLRYDGAYFWNSLDVNLGAKPTVDYLKTAPTSHFPTYLKALGNTDDLFQKYALLMTQGPAQALIPNAPTLPATQDVLGVPGTTEIPLPNAFDFRIDDLGLLPPPDKGVELIATGFESSGTWVDLLSEDGSTQALVEGAPISICSSVVGLKVVSSRANDKTVKGSMQIAVAEIDCPPKETDKSAACLVGTWTAIAAPPALSDHIDFKPGDIQFTVNADYTGTFRVSGVTSKVPNSKDQAIINLMTGHGQFTPVADDKVTGRFTLKDSTGTIDQVDVSVTINGQTVKLPGDSFLNLLKQLASSGTTSPTIDSLTCVGDSTMFYEMSLGTVVWVRMSPPSGP